MHTIYESQSIAALATALSAFQGEVEGAKKTAKNPHLGNKYADLASIWDVVREPLAKNGLAVIQRPMPSDDNRLHLETRLLHKSGEFIASEITMPLTKNDPQGYGSALTYARRYGLAAMLGITQEDDDAEAATSRQPAPAESRSTARQAAPKRQAQPAPAPETEPQASEERPVYSETQKKNLVAMKTAREKVKLGPEQVANMCKRMFSKAPVDVAASDEDTAKLIHAIENPGPADAA